MTWKRKEKTEGHRLPLCRGREIAMLEFYKMNPSAYTFIIFLD